MTDVYGNINWWGFCPALDLQEIGLNEMCKKLVCAPSEDLHILLVGAGDIRHILKTVARRYRHTKRRIKFYLTDTALELYARNMLLMMVALERQQKMGLQEKTELFLELYGNTLVRQQSNQYVEKMAHELIKMVTNFDYLEEKLPFFDLNQLKYKERDFLEGILKFWRNTQKIPFDITKCWDLRLRQQLGVRYDSRQNVYDWDYNMELLERGGSIVYLHQYKNWREKGVAFEIREGTYDVPNRTLASGIVIKHDGEKFPRRGYWGDMIVSPYITFGIETEEKSFYRKQNNQHIKEMFVDIHDIYGLDNTKTAEDVSEFNITSLFHEIATNSKYELPKLEPKVDQENVKETAKLEEITEEEDQNENTKEQGKEGEKLESKELEKEIQKDEGKKSDKIDKTISCGETKDEEKTHDNQSHNKAEPQAEGTQSEDFKESGEQVLDWMSLEDVKITFLPLAYTPELLKKSKYHKLFNVVFFSNSMVHHLKPEVSHLFADKCAVVLETALFMLDLKKDHVKEFVSKITGLAKATGCQPLETCDELQDSYIKFYYER